MSGAAGSAPPAPPHPPRNSPPPPEASAPGGFTDRLNSLPIPRAAVLAGRAVADTSILAWSLAVTTAIGFLVGFRLHASRPAALAAFGLCVVFGFAFTWLFMTLGMLAGTAQAAQGMSLMVFPFTFVSSAYVPVSTMPSWMRGFVQHQPITVMVDAVRALSQGPAAEALLGHTAGYFVVRSLLWSTALVVAFLPVAVWRFKQR